MIAMATSFHETSTPGLSCCHGPSLMRKWKPCSTASERCGTAPKARCTLSRPKPERIIRWFFGSEQRACSIARSGEVGRGRARSGAIGRDRARSGEIGRDRGEVGRAACSISSVFSGTTKPPSSRWS